MAIQIIEENGYTSSNILFNYKEVYPKVSIKTIHYSNKSGRNLSLSNTLKKTVKEIFHPSIKKMPFKGSTRYAILGTRDYSI